MNTDEFKFDFIVHGDKIGEFESFFEAYGSKIYHVTPRRQNPVKNIIEIAAVIKNGNYDVVHCHQDYKGAINAAFKTPWSKKNYSQSPCVSTGKSISKSFKIYTVFLL